MSETKEQFKESEGWEQVPDLDSFWIPEAVGDTVKGVYIEKETNVGRNHAEVYVLKKCPESEGEDPILYKIFGTKGLSKKMEDIPIGYEVGIIYQGEKPSAPPKKPFKVFDVFKRKYQNEEDVGELVSDDVEENNNPLGDPIAAKCIDEITDDLLTEMTEVTEKTIKERAKQYHIAGEEGYKDPQILVRIEKQLEHKG